MSPARARCTLILAVVFVAGCVAVSLSPWAKGRADETGRGANDMSLYRDEVVRVAGGEAYYDAAGSELRKQGYPTAASLTGERRCWFGFSLRCQARVSDKRFSVDSRFCSHSGRWP
jgi:hypothetical protein